MNAILIILILSHNLKNNVQAYMYIQMNIIKIINEHYKISSEVHMFHQSEEEENKFKITSTISCI